jgi:hypothetical protein
VALFGYAYILTASALCESESIAKERKRRAARRMRIEQKREGKISSCCFPVSSAESVAYNLKPVQCGDLNK